MLTPIHTRFAPSPTGNLHIGGVWMALMQWLAAKSSGGSLLLRIDDTDQSRLVEGSEEQIIEVLDWYGITFDKGPVRQSERRTEYAAAIKKLITTGHAYRCVCTSERLQAVREEQQRAKKPTRYDGHCRDANLPELNEAHVIRLKVPTEGATTFQDLIRGDVTFQHQEVDDQVLIKSDGLPTYHFATVVDDHAFGVNTVIRGEEWLSSTPKHVLLYEAFGWDLPSFAHLPLIVGQDKTKLSKRHGAVDALAYRDDGYLAPALINFLALLGWHPRDDQEIFSLPELVNAFSLDRVGKSPAVFDKQKLDWLNGQHLRSMTPDDLYDAVIPFLSSEKPLKSPSEPSKPAKSGQDSTAVKKSLVAVRDRVSRLTEFTELIVPFSQRLSYEAPLLVAKKSDVKVAQARLARMETFFNELPEDAFVEEKLETEIRELIENEGLGLGKTLWPLRVALSGLAKSPSPFSFAAVLGKTETLARIELAQKKLM